MSNIMNYISGYIVPLIFIGLGLFILFSQYRLFNKNNYITATAKIIKSSKHIRTENLDGLKTLYGVKLEYEYEVLGKKYISSNIFKNSKSYFSSDPEWPEEFIKNYPVGKDISIMVMKDKPSDAYIIEKSPGTWLLNGLAVLAVISGILIWYFN